MSLIVASDLEWNSKEIDVLGFATDQFCTAVGRDETTLKQYLEILHKADIVVGQNYLDADVMQMQSEGIDTSWLEPKVRDIRLLMHAYAGHLAGTGSYDLRSITLLLGSRQGKRFVLDWKKYESDLHATCAVDSAATIWNYRILEPLIEQYNLQKTVEISHKCAPIFARMARQGVRLDKSVLEKIYYARKSKTEELIEKHHLWEERGKKVIKRVPIWRSNKLLDVCQERFGIRPKDRQRQTWVKLLDTNLAPDMREFVEAIVELGKGSNDAHWLGKPEESEDGLDFSKVASDGFIYPRYDICGSPDRAIASSPNIQNFPRPGDDPRIVKLRSAIVGLTPEHTLVGVDFSSVETITNAFESNDMDRVRASLEGRISHQGTADLLNKSMGLSLERHQGKAVNHGFDKGECVAPNTKILKADLTWIDAASLRDGDELIGFDEKFHGKKSKYRRSVVQSVGRVVNPCYLIETDKGDMIASANHAWLVRNFEGVYKWRITSKLRVGRQLKFFGHPWILDNSHAAGCLKGFFDGEGNICRNGKTSTQLSVSQNVGETLEHYKSLLRYLDYPIRERHKTHKNSTRICASVAIRNRYSAMRFLGSLRPVRLLPEASRFWEDVSVAGGRHEKPATISRITFIGERETVAIKTSTKTIITNGFLTHNSPYNLARTLFKTERPARQAVLQCQTIFKEMLSKYPKTAQFRDELWERATDNPLTVTNCFGRRLQCFSRSKYGGSGGYAPRHDPYKKYWCPCRECSPRRDRWKYAIAFLGRSSAFDALLRKMADIWYEKRLDEYSLPMIECHDELVFSVPREKAQHYGQLAKDCFEEPIEELGGISLPASVEIGDSWAEAH